MLEQLIGLSLKEIVGWLMVNQSEMVDKKVILKTGKKHRKHTLGSIELDHERFLYFLNQKRKVILCAELDKMLVGINNKTETIIFLTTKKVPAAIGDELTIFV